MYRRNALLGLLVLILIPMLADANMLTNSSFENPTNTESWANTGWAGDHGERKNWNPREGLMSGIYWSWDDNASGWVYQDVAVTTGGTFGAGIWIRLETNVPAANTASMTIAWYDALTNPLGPASTAVYPAVPTDGNWHNIHVKGTCTSSSLALVRARFDTSWGASPFGDQTTYYYDNGELFRDDENVRIGSETAIWNGGFEQGSTNWWETFRGSQWDYGFVGGEEGCRREPWTGHKGQWLLAFRGWEAAHPAYSAEVSQRFVPRALGTNTLSFWVKREAGFSLTNFQAWIEWYDSTFTNKVKTNDLVNFTAQITNDAVWRQFSIETVCTNTALNEARVVLLVQWVTNDLGGSKSMMIDDVQFLAPGEDGSYIETDWGYHAGTGYYAVAEQVPGGGYGAFMQANFVTRTNTFYALSKHPAIAKNPGEFGSVGLRTSWPYPGGDWSNNEYKMTYLGTLALDSGAPFHGLPAAGAVTVDVWRTEAPQPRDVLGNPFTTNTVPFYYAPYMLVTTDVAQVDLQYLLFNGGDSINNLGQRIGSEYGSKDYLYWNRVPAPNTTLSNADFEATTGWLFGGSGGFEPWANHSAGGAQGGAFWSWGAGDAMVYQDVETTGGVYSFASWFKMESGCNPVDVRLRMAWYNTNGIVVQVDETDVTSRLRGFGWVNVAVEGQCLEPGLDFVRLSLSGRFLSEIHAGAAIMIDDVEFYSGSYTGVTYGGFTNGGFEDGLGATPDRWVGDPNSQASREQWAKQNGIWGGAFHSYTNVPGTEAALSQWVNATPGPYTFTAWLFQEVGMLDTNVEMRIEWYDLGLNKVQVDSVAVLDVTNAAPWTEYTLDGTCNDPDLFVARVVIFAQWDHNPIDIGRAMFIDDVTFEGGIAPDSDGDGIPDWWELLHFDGPTNADASAHSDVDTWSDGEEWVFDTDPTNVNSFLNNSFTNKLGATNGVMSIQAGPPTSPDREYDVWWRMDITDNNDWTRYGLAVPGIGPTTPVTLTVTNNAPGRIYRWGVVVP